eukprot:Nk52_evm9s351 gene=Nk52_evmTU9s351
MKNQEHTPSQQYNNNTHSNEARREQPQKAEKASGHMIDQFAHWVDQHYRQVRAGLLLCVGIGALMVGYHSQYARTWRRVEEIPGWLFMGRGVLRGRVIGCGTLGSNLSSSTTRGCVSGEVIKSSPRLYLTFRHDPLLGRILRFYPFCGQEKGFLCYLAGISVPEGSKADQWVTDNVIEPKRRVKIRLVNRENDLIYSTMKFRKGLFWYDAAEEIVKNGLAKVSSAPIVTYAEKQSRESGGEGPIGASDRDEGGDAGRRAAQDLAGESFDFQANLTKSLLQAELKAEKNRVGVWEKRGDLEEEGVTINFENMMAHRSSSSNNNGGNNSNNNEEGNNHHDQVSGQYANLKQLAEDLHNEHNVIEALSALSLYLDEDSNKSTTIQQQQQRRSAASSSPTVKFFECISLEDILRHLDTSDPECTGERNVECCRLLEKLFERVDPLAIVVNMKESIKAGVGHVIGRVRVLTIALLRLCVRDTEGLLFVIQNDLFLPVVSCLGDDALKVVKEASLFLSEVSESDNGLRSICCQETMHVLEALIEKGSVVKFRVFEIVVQICLKSEKNFRSVNDSGNAILQALLSPFLGDKSDLVNIDVLDMVNYVELYKEMAKSEMGLSFLNGNGVLSGMVNLMKRIAENPLLQMVSPSIFEVFSTILESHTADFGELNDNLDLLSLLDQFLLVGDNEVIELICLRMYGAICASESGIRSVREFDNRMSNTGSLTGKVVQYIDSGNQSFVVNLLNSLGNIFATREPSVASIQKTIFVEIPCQRKQNMSTMSFLLKRLHMPFDEERFAILAMMKQLAAHTWAIELFFKCPGLMEYLLNRTMDTSPQGLNLKYQLNKELLETGTKCINDPNSEIHSADGAQASSVEVDMYIGASRDLLKRLGVYVNEGVFHKTSAMSVAYESGH